MTRSIPWRRGLGAKLAALIGCITLLCVGLFALAAIRAQERYAIEQLRSGAGQLSETIKSSVHHHMLADDRLTAYGVMETIGRQAGIDTVRMFNREGRVTFSTDPAEVGQVPDAKRSTCAGCHHAPKPDDPRLVDPAVGHQIGRAHV